jgi:hypothetical protein
MSGTVNLCTPVFHTAPETDGTDGVKVEYRCTPGAYIRSCRWYVPVPPQRRDTCPYNECDHFDAGCTCAAARAAAMKRSKRILRRFLLAPKKGGGK